MDISTLIPSFGGFLFTAAAFIIALSVIVTVHEFGHYIVGRWSGIHAEVFSIGFGPVIWSRTDRRGTKWQIAALPFGGYVKFLGDSDAASSGTDEEAVSALSEEELRHTMHGAPLWARFLTVLAGPVFNFLLSILLFSALALTIGIAREPLTVEEIYPLPVEGITVEPGDALLAVEGKALPRSREEGGKGLWEIGKTLPRRDLLTYDVARGEAQTQALGPQLFPTRVGGVNVNSAAREAGIRTGDVILKIDGEKVYRFDEMVEMVKASGGRAMTLEVWREGDTFEVTLKPRRRDIPKGDGTFETRWLMGIQSSLFFIPATTTPDPLTAITLGAARTWGVIRLSASGIYHLLTGQISSCNVSGPVGIARASGSMASEGLAAFIGFIALLSTAIGFLNLLPVPMLDGGHLVFYAWEAITGRPPNEKLLRILMTIGLVLVLGLMAFGLSNDLTCK